MTSAAVQIDTENVLAGPTNLTKKRRGGGGGVKPGLCQLRGVLPNILKSIRIKSCVQVYKNC